MTVGNRKGGGKEKAARRYNTNKNQKNTARVALGTGADGRASRNMCFTRLGHLAADQLADAAPRSSHTKKEKKDTGMSHSPCTVRLVRMMTTDGRRGGKREKKKREPADARLSRRHDIHLPGGCWLQTYRSTQGEAGRRKEKGRCAPAPIRSLPAMSVDDVDATAGRVTKAGG